MLAPDTPLTETDATPSFASRLGGRWRAMSRWQRTQFVALLLIVIGALVHQLLLLHWYIEDAAISFTFARHLAEGEGLVAYPGGERVEGYSNPLWMLIMSVVLALGLDPVPASKLIALACAATLLVLLYRALQLFLGSLQVALPQAPYSELHIALCRSGRIGLRHLAPGHLRYAGTDNSGGKQDHD